MKIDIHRHAADPGKADRVMRNLFHDQQDQVESGKLFSAGLHPWHVKEDHLEDDLESVREMAGMDQVIAIGEAGLDKSIKVPIELQMKAFRKQIAIAEEVKKPMILHCVRAYNEVFELHREANPAKPWIVHWFNASEQMAEQLVSHGFYLSFGHMLFNERSKAFRAFATVPPERFFLETDDADYAIDEVYHRAAGLRRVEIGELEKQLENNFYTCFGIKP